MNLIGRHPWVRSGIGNRKSCQEPVFCFFDWPLDHIGIPAEQIGQSFARVCVKKRFLPRFGRLTGVGAGVAWARRVAIVCWGVSVCHMNLELGL